MLKKHLPSVLLVLGSVAFSGMLGEMFLRMTSVFPPDVHAHDPHTGLIYFSPNSSTPWQNTCITNTIESNAAGFHAFPYSPSKTDNEFRIAIVGDSMTEALQVSRKEHAAHLLEEKLNALPGKHPHYTVRPFGISGNGTYLNTLYAKTYVVDFAPDLIINAFFLGNDVDNDARPMVHVPRFDAEGELLVSPAGQQGISWTTRVKALLKHSAIVRGAYHAYLSMRERRLDETLTVSTTTPTMSSSQQIYLSHDIPFWEDAWRTEARLLKGFDRLSREHQATFMVLSIADPIAIHPELTRAAFSQMEDIDLMKPEKRLAQITAELEIPTLSLGSIFRYNASSTGAMSYWSCDRHWNQTGHQWAADALFGYFLTNQKLIGIE